MKNLILVLFTLFSFTTFSQEYMSVPIYNKNVY